MSLYEALEGLVGAGLMAAAPVCDVEFAANANRNGTQLFALLRERGVAGHVTPVIDAMSREIWTGRDENGMPRQISEGHVQALTSVLQLHHPDPAEIVAAVEKARSGFSGHIGTSVSPSLSIAEAVLRRAKSGSALGDGERGQAAASFLLHRLFAHLLDDPGLLPTLKPVLFEYRGHGLTPPANPARAGAMDNRPQASEQVEHAQSDEAGEITAIAQICQRTGLGPSALARFMELLDRGNVKTDQRLIRLAEMAEWLKETRAQLMRPSNDEAEARRLKSKAASALAEGDFEGAMECLKQVRRHVRDGRRRIEERLQDEVVGLRAQMLEEAHATARLAELALTRLELDTAIELFGEAIDSLPSGDPVDHWRLSMRLGEALYRKGTQKQDASALQQAAAAYEGTLKLLVGGKHGREIGAANAALGNALARLGEHEKGAPKLVEAVSAFRRAVAAMDSDADTRLRALTLVQLGMALSSLSEHGDKAGSYRDAIAAFKEALTGIDKADTGEWTAAQMGLGAALLGLDEQESDRQLLAEAAHAYAQSLTILTRERNGDAWALAHTNLGNALLGLGMAEGMSAKLEDAVAAYRQALKVHTRDAAADQWALVHLNLGNALASLGDRDAAATSRHEEAVVAYQHALEVFTRDATPLRWAITQMNLGTALIRLGERGEKRHHWLAAAAAMVPALDVFEAEGAKDYADLTRRNLRKFHTQWEQLIGPATELLPAIEGRARVIAKAI